MLRGKRRWGALVALAVLGSVFIPGSARAAETYTVKVGQDFFGEGVQAFSTRMYPGSVTVHRGDTIVFDNGGVGLVPNGAYPQEWLGENWAKIDQDWFYFASDPDEGPKAIKFNESIFAPGTCGAADNPCQLSGDETDLQVPEETADDKMHVEVTAQPGTTVWAVTGPFTDINSNLKITVVGPQEAASTQAELDQRAQQLLRKDYEDALALDAHMNGKRTSHRTKSGQKVFDVWVGGVGGPIELFDSYPKKISVPQGARVQYHFMSEIEPHTATFGGSKAKSAAQNGITPACDPDGDSGTAPDTTPEFGEQGPICPDTSTIEFDVANRFAYETGDNVVKNSEDYENSGIKAPVYPDGSDFLMTPWTVKFPTKSTSKGFKYICVIHGGFMGGTVVVK